MVFIFGDLRQLRKFELARPPISRPKPLTGLAISSPMSTATPRGSLTPPQMLAIAPPSRLFVRNQPNPPPQPPTPPTHEILSYSTSSVHDASASVSVSACSDSTGTECPGRISGLANYIDISPEYYDERPAP